MHKALEDWLKHSGDATADAPITTTTFEGMMRPVDLATALLPRLRKWFPQVVIAEVELATKATCDAWKTAARRGLSAAACILCDRRNSDSSKHLTRCPLLWRAVTCASAIPPPKNLAQAIALRTSEPFGMRRPSGKHAPPTFVFRLALACDT